MTVNQHIFVSNLSVSFNGTRIIHNLSLNVTAGKFVSIVGPSGSGKSTLLHAVAGFIPSSGTIEVPSSLGVVFQKDGVFPFMTVEDNLRFGINGTSASNKDSIIDSLLSSTGLSNMRKRYPASLSGGQVQRLNFARTFASDPSAILCDEPFSALDEIRRTQMESWLLNYWEGHKKTIVFVTHSIEEAIFLSDEVLVLRDGDIAKTFKVDLSRPRLQEIKFDENFLALRRSILDEFQSPEAR